MDTPDEIDKDDIKRLKESPPFFVEKVIGETPYPYQEQFLESDNKNRVFVAGRQVGKTTTLCWLAIHKAATHPNSNIFILAPSRRQAKNVFHGKLKAEIPQWVENPEEWGIIHETMSELQFSNGSHIQALPAANQSGTGETIRGFTVDMILCDEAAFIDDDFYTSVLKPMTFHTSGDMMLFGTAWGKSGYFYEKYNNERWFSIQVATPECPDIDEEEIEEAKEDLSSTEYDREILAHFSQDKNAAFPAEAIRQCTYKGEEPGDIYPEFSGGRCWLGVDPARFGEDESVYILFDDEGNVFDHIINGESSGTDVQAEVQKLNDEYSFQKILVDETGFGGGPLDNLKEALPNVDGVEFTLKSKQDIYQTLIKEMEAVDITIPDDRKFIGQLRDIQYELTPRGKVKYHAPSGGRDDIPDALALAVWASRGGSPARRATGVYTMSGSSPKNDKRPRRTGRNRFRFN